MAHDLADSNRMKRPLLLTYFLVSCLLSFASYCIVKWGNEAIDRIFFSLYVLGWVERKLFCFIKKFLCFELNCLEFVLFFKLVDLLIYYFFEHFYFSFLKVFIGDHFLNVLSVVDNDSCFSSKRDNVLFLRYFFDFQLRNKKNAITSLVS